MGKNVITDFSGYADEELVKDGEIIDAQITANEADLGTMPVAPAAYHTHLTDFSSILGMPVYPEKTADLKAAKKLVVKDLHKNGVHFNEFADGVETILAKTGYPYAKDPSPIGILPKGSIKKITSILGGFEIEVYGIENARGHMICLMPTIDLLNGSKAIANKFGKWPWYHSTTTKFRIEDLDSSVKYTIVTCGVGSDKTLNFSDPIERTTQ